MPMQVVGAWQWLKNYVPPHIQTKRGNIVKILDIELSRPEKVGDITSYHDNPACLVTGDGRSLAEDVKEFESWNVPHDLYCVNRSMLFFERAVKHWAAIDVEESTWFSANVNSKIEPDTNKPIHRHTIGTDSFAYDIYWKMDDKYTDMQRRVMVGSTGYFGVLTALKMGYEKIVLAGMPLDFEPHWYDPPDAEGPQWGGYTFSQWMDFQMQHSRAPDVRSMCGYSAFILGTATKEWLNG